MGRCVQGKAHGGAAVAEVPVETDDSTVWVERSGSIKLGLLIDDNRLVRPSISHRGLIRETDPADASVALVGDEEVAIAIHGHVERSAQLGAGGRSAVAAKPKGAVPGHGGDDARGGVHPANSVVALVGDEEVAKGIRGYVDGLLKTGAGGRSIVPSKLSEPVPGHGGDDARGGNHQNGRASARERVYL